MIIMKPKTLLDKLRTSFLDLSDFMPENYLHILVHLPGSKLKEIMKTVDKLKHFILRYIKDHRQSFDPNEPRCEKTGFLHMRKKT